MIGHRIVSSFHAALHLGWEYVCVCGILSRPRPALDLLFTSTGMMMGWLLLADLMPFSVLTWLAGLRNRRCRWTGQRMQTRWTGQRMQTRWKQPANR